MLKVAIIGSLAALAGAIGYFGEPYMRPTAAPPPESSVAMEEKVLLFSLPLGKFTIQVMQPRSTLHIVFDIDVYVMGAKAFEQINGAVGRARLRDAMIGVIAELAELDQRLLRTPDQEELREELAAEVVRRLNVQFPVIRSARINTFHVNTSLRE